MKEKTAAAKVAAVFSYHNPAHSKKLAQPRWRLFGLIRSQMVAQPFYDNIFVPFVQFLLHFFERKVNYIVVMQFLWRQYIAKAQPQTVQ